MAPRRLVLVGGGHAHVEVLRQAARLPFAGDVVLVSPYREQLYTGMLPAQLNRQVHSSALTLDLARLCRRAGAQFVQSHAVRVEAEDGGVLVHTASGIIHGDVCSLNVGSIAAGLQVPGAREFAFTVRPLPRWRALLQQVRRLAESGAASPVPVVVVGGGAGGVEIALALEAALRQVPARQSNDASTEAPPRARVAVVTAQAEAVPEFGPRGSEKVRTLLQTRGIALITGQAVACVAGDHVMLANGERVESALTVWATGASPPALLQASGLPIDRDGHLLVDSTLRSVSGAPVFGAGDCIAIAQYPELPKAGVQAVREAPVLTRNLRVMLGGGAALQAHVPQRRTLAILNTSDGRALLHWRGGVAYGRWALWLKRWIDERWVKRYQQE